MDRSLAVEGLLFANRELTRNGDFRGNAEGDGGCAASPPG
jgi:hypothetical protein